MAGLTWLHISDWHQHGSDFNRQVVSDLFLEDIRNRARINPDLEKIDFVVFSGDAAFSGNIEEYHTAIAVLFRPVLEATELGTHRLFMVPGNHDFDRQAISSLPSELHTPFTTDIQVNDWLTNDEKRRQLLIPFTAYEQFMHEYTGRDQSANVHLRRLWVSGKQIALLELNSALMCGRHLNENKEVDDRGFLVVGEPQIHDTLMQMANADLRIAVIHHPFDWLTEFDRDRVQDRLKKSCHFILSGHLHRPRVTLEQGISECALIPSGALYDKRIPHHPRYTNAYNFVHLDFESASGTAYLRRWSDTGTEWIADYESYSDGFFSFRLPKHTNGETPKSKQLQSIDPITLRQAMHDAYNIAGLQLLCANLHIRYEDLNSGPLEVQILSLVEYMQQRGRYPELVQQVLRERPHLADRI